MPEHLTLARSGLAARAGSHHRAAIPPGPSRASRAAVPRGPSRASRATPTTGAQSHSAASYCNRAPATTGHKHGRTGEDERRSRCGVPAIR